ncbi:hypothetical protein [Paenibacillus xylanilyticus]|uniref:Uncharacterized protein n=1 Tax=Paenibacillus xylanilyticus TaxID=248903 RepID=A0A7Y6BUE8_9BACL|nr:hypothetical protein [Paenibacillus xylanilyticus]NUU74626.1 hypothetical protein [Paenibacillus xylanilyticus]
MNRLFIQEPYCKDDLILQAGTEKKIRAVVGVNLEELISSDEASFKELLSKRVTTATGFAIMSCNMAGILNEELLIEVIGHVKDIRESFTQLHMLKLEQELEMNHIHDPDWEKKILAIFQDALDNGYSSIWQPEENELARLSSFIASFCERQNIDYSLEIENVSSLAYLVFTDELSKTFKTKVGKLVTFDGDALLMKSFLLKGTFPSVILENTEDHQLKRISIPQYLKTLENN